MVEWRLAEAIKVLQHEVNTRYPDRPRQSDGTIASAAHHQQNPHSDHEPNPPHAGVVTAWDITTADFTVNLAETLRVMGKAGDRRVKYVIYRGRITSAQHGWQWGTYDGQSPHTDHIHLSVSDTPAFYDSLAAWNVFSATPHAQIQEDELTADDLSKIDALIKAHVDAAVAQLHRENVLILHGDATDGHVNSLDSIAKQVGVPQP